MSVELFMPTLRRMARRCRNLSGPRVEVEDLISEGVTAILASGEELGVPPNLCRGAYRAAHNAMFSFRYRQQRGDDRRSGVVPASVEDRREVNPLLAAMDNDTWESLLTLVHRGVRREAELHLRGGLTLKEVGELSGITEQAECKRLKPTKLMLGRELSRRGVASRANPTEFEEFPPGWDVAKPVGHKGRHRPVESNLGERYGNAASAARALGMHPRTVSTAIARNQRAWGRWWRYVGPHSKAEVA